MNAASAGTAPIVATPASERLARKTIAALFTHISLGLLFRSLGFIESLILVRVFAPTDFGLFTTATLIVSLLTIVSFSDLTKLIVRADDASYKSVTNLSFTINAIFGLASFCIVFAAAPFAAHLFHDPSLTPFIRFLAFAAFQPALTTPRSLWDRQLRFGIQRVPDIAARVARLLVAVPVAVVLGWSTWGLFYGQLASFVITMVCIWALVPYRPRIVLTIDKPRANEMFRFGLPLVGASFLGFIVWHGDDLLVRYFWGDAQLAIYTLAFSLPLWFAQFVDLTSAVLYPIFSRLESRKDNLEELFARANQGLAMLCFPVGIFLVLYAPQVVTLAFGESWSDAGDLLRIFGVAFGFRASTGYNWTLLVTRPGRSHLLLWGNILGFAGMILMGVPLIWTYGPLGGAILNLFNVIVGNSILRYFVIKREFGSVKCLLPTVRPIVVASTVGGAMFLAGFGASTIFGLLTVAVLYFGVYGVVVAAFEWRTLQALYDTLRHQGAPP